MIHRKLYWEASRGYTQYCRFPFVFCHIDFAKWFVCCLHHIIQYHTFLTRLKPPLLTDKISVATSHQSLTLSIMADPWWQYTELYTNLFWLMYDLEIIFVYMFSYMFQQQCWKHQWQFCRVVDYCAFIFWFWDTGSIAMVWTNTH